MHISIGLPAPGLEPDEQNVRLPAPLRTDRSDTPSIRFDPLWLRLEPPGRRRTSYRPASSQPSVRLELVNILLCLLAALGQLVPSVAERVLFVSNQPADPSTEALGVDNSPPPHDQEVRAIWHPPELVGAQERPGKQNDKYQSPHCRQCLRPVASFGPSAGPVDTRRRVRLPCNCRIPPRTGQTRQEKKSGAILTPLLIKSALPPAEETGETAQRPTVRPGTTPPVKEEVRKCTRITTA